MTVNSDIKDTIVTICTILNDGELFQSYIRSVEEHLRDGDLDPDYSAVRKQMLFNLLIDLKENTKDLPDQVRQKLFFISFLSGINKSTINQRNSLIKKINEL